MWDPWTGGKGWFDQTFKTWIVDSGGNLTESMEKEGICFCIVHLKINKCTTVKEKITNGG